MKVIPCKTCGGAGFIETAEDCLFCGGSGVNYTDEDQAEESLPD